MIDDLDGKVVLDGEGGTVQFAFRGKNYELELSRENEQKLADLLEPFIAVARQGKRTADESAGSASRPKPKSQRAYAPGDAREWLQANGYSIPERGPIKKEYLRLYEEARGLM